MASSTAHGQATNRGEHGQGVNQDSQAPPLLFRSADAAAPCNVCVATAEPPNPPGFHWKPCSRVHANLAGPGPIIAS